MLTWEGDAADGTMEEERRGGGLDSKCQMSPLDALVSIACFQRVLPIRQTPVLLQQPFATMTGIWIIYSFFTKTSGGVLIS